MATPQPTTVMVRSTPTQIDTIVVDACVTYTDELKNTITDHDVEEGFKFSDHSRPEPDNVSLECYITDNPASREQQARAVASGSATFSPVEGEDPVEQPGYSNSQYLALKALRDDPKLFTVLTRLRTYRNMGIESISTPVTAKDASAIHFTIKCKQIRIVKNKLTRDVVAKDTRAGSSTKLGNQTPRDVTPTPKTQTTMQSVYKGAVGLTSQLGGGG